MSTRGEDSLAVARRVLELEASALRNAAANLDDEFLRAVEIVLSSSGRVVVCGMGKSGIIGRKVSATLASTGTPSFFLHPGEAYHGDLGMVASEDCFVALSNSGETEELVKLLPFLRDNGNPLIALTGSRNSTLARAANCHIDAGVDVEACPLNLAPTSSTTTALAIGDALAVALMNRREFQPEQFARFHPGGSLGRRLLRTVADEMVSTNLPVVDADSGAVHVMSVMSGSGLGMAIVRFEGEFGLVTDGDLRRAIEEHQEKLFDLRARDFCSRDPQTITPGARLEDALAKMDSLSITSLVVVDKGVVMGVVRK